MAFPIPTTKQTTDKNLANLEGAIGQTSPLADKAFLKVLAGMEGLNHTELFKFAAERSLQNLALTATGEDLRDLGGEYGVGFKNAVAAVLAADLPATNGTNISATTPFIGDSNGERYFPETSVIAAGGVAALSLQAETPGVSGNLNPGETLTIGTQIPGATTTATVTAITTTGAEAETDDEYRVRVLARVRSPGGGGNSADYRRWAEEVSGVKRAYPFAGRPFADIENSVPPERTVNIEAETTIDPDGIPPSGLLDQVRTNIITDPVTDKTRQPLGLTNDTLFVEPIRRTEIFTSVSGLTVDTGIEGQVQSDIEDALEDYYRSLRPFVVGLDPEFDRNDLITDLTVSEVVQSVVAAAGGSAIGVAFALSFGGPALAFKQLDFDETIKAGTTTFL